MPSPEAIKKRLRERAQRLAMRVEPVQAAVNGLEVVEFTAGSMHYGIETCHVREVKAVHEISWIPGVPAYVLGLVKAGGEILTLLDIRHFLGLAGQAGSEPGKMVLLQAPGRAFALHAEAIVGVQRITLQDNPAALPSVAAGRARYVKGVTAASLIVLDGQALLHAPGMMIADHGNLPAAPAGRS